MSLPKSFSQCNCNGCIELWQVRCDCLGTVDTWPEHSFCVFFNTRLSNSGMIAWFCSRSAFYIKCSHSLLAFWIEALISKMESILFILSVAGFHFLRYLFWRVLFKWSRLNLLRKEGTVLNEREDYWVWSFPMSELLDFLFLCYHIFSLRNTFPLIPK